MQSFKIDMRQFSGGLFDLEILINAILGFRRSSVDAVAASETLEGVQIPEISSEAARI